MQAAIIGLGRLLNMAAAAGTVMVLARIMPDKESYGAVLLLIMLYVMLSQVFAVGLPQAIYYFLPRYQGGVQRGFLTQIVLLLVASGLLLGAILFLSADLLGQLLHTPKLPALLRIFALYPIGMLPTLAVEGALLIHNRPLTVVIFNVIVRVGMFCALVIPSWLGASLPTTITVWVVHSMLMGVIALVLIFSTVRRVPTVWQRPMLRELWAFSLPLALLTVVSLCGTYMDRLLVSHFFGAATFGAYSNATFEIPTVTMVTNATAIVLLAEFSRLAAVGDNHAIVATWRRATLKTGILIFASFGFLALWGHETMRLLFSDRFAESGAVFSIYVWLIPMNIFAMRPLYLARGATKMLTGLTLLDVTAGLTCMLIFGHWFGVRGIALGVVVASYLTAGPWVYVYTCRLTRIGCHAFMPWGKVALALALALLAGIASRFIVRAIAPNWELLPTLAFGLTLYAVFYLLALAATHLLEVILPPRLLHRRRQQVEDDAPETVENTIAP